MLITRFSPKHFELMAVIKKDQSATAREQSVYSPFAFYMNIGMLKHYGLVKENGVGMGNRKIWVLTPKGEKFLGCINVIETMLMEEISHGKVDVPVAKKQ